MKDNEIIIVKQDNKNMFFKYQNNVYSYYNCSTKKLLFRIMKNLNIPLTMFYGNWKDIPNGCKYIVFFDYGYRSEFAKYVKGHYSNIKLIFWYWNSINEKNRKFLYDKNIDEVWTYNRFDAQKYNISYNPQFYYYKKHHGVEKMVSNSDVVFMGMDKGRDESIQNIKEFLEKKALKCSFYVIHKVSDFMDYEVYLQEVENSKCILDFSHIIPCGLSLRPLEAIFMHKKLITNNNDIVNYKFYNKNNIYILGVENDRDINEFMNCPYINISDNIINYYSYDSWLERFKE